MKKSSDEFFVHLQKLNERMQDKGLSERQLSKNIGRSPSWVNDIKKRADNNLHFAKIKLTDAINIARELDCEIEDFAAPDEKYCEGMSFDYQAAAQDRFNMLVKSDPSFLAELLHYLEAYDKQKKQFLLSLAREISEHTIYRNENEKWWRYLLFTELGRALFAEIDNSGDSRYTPLDVCKESVLESRYKDRCTARIQELVELKAKIQELRERGAEEQELKELEQELKELKTKENSDEYVLYYDGYVEIMKAVLRRYVEKWMGLFELYDDRVKETILKNCANFLVLYFHNKESAPDVIRLSNLYKLDLWGMFYYR